MPSLWKDISYGSSGVEESYPILRARIEVTAFKSKTASRRLVTIQPNLKAWLAPLARSSRRVQPPNSRKLREAAQRRAGIGKWPTDALRHSFASFHLAKFQDAPALALQMGHTTTAMLFAHYREVVTPEAAEAYWKIKPQTKNEEAPNGKSESIEQPLA